MQLVNLYSTRFVNTRFVSYLDYNTESSRLTIHFTDSLTKGYDLSVADATAWFQRFLDVGFIFAGRKQVETWAWTIINPYNLKYTSHADGYYSLEMVGDTAGSPTIGPLEKNPEDFKLMDAYLKYGE